MSKALKFGGAAAAVVVAILIGLRSFGLEPQDRRPGLWLSGEVVEEPVADWSFTDEHDEIHVQTNTWYGIPHSVTTYCAVHDDELYLFSAYYGGGPFPETRTWNVNAMRDSRVRLKIGERLYDQRVEHVTDESLRQAVIESFESKYPEWDNPGDDDVHVFRVQPR